MHKEWVKQQEEIDEEGVESMNVLLRSRDFIGSTDAGGNHLKLKEPKLQALTTPKLSQPSPGTSVGKKAQIAAGEVLVLSLSSVERRVVMLPHNGGRSFA